MLRKGFILIIMLSLGVGGTGCDKVKGVIKKGKNYFANSEKTATTETKVPNQGKPAADSKPSRPRPSSTQNDIAEAGQDGGTAYRNEPITYGTLEPDQYTLLMKRFKDQYACEDYSRQLRRQRINNFIVYEPASKKYLILTGRFVTKSQAERQAEVFAREGYPDVQIYGGN